MIRRTYNGWGLGPLDQLTPANVARLHPVWVASTAEARPHEAAPIVNNGVMFVSTPNNQVIAIDAKEGNVLWQRGNSSGNPDCHLGFFSESLGSSRIPNVFLHLRNDRGCGDKAMTDVVDHNAKAL